jgi:hypothetical protein
MTKNKINLKELSKLLSRFFDKGFDIPEGVLSMSGAFLFHGAKFTESHKYADLVDTLKYLKDVKERNRLKELNDLVQYYEKKQRGINELFDRFEETAAEERFALNFEGACKTYLKVNRIVHPSKSDGLYYPMTPESNYMVGFENISYSDSLELEMRHLAQVKGNMLIKQQNVSCVASEKIDPLVSN